MRQCAVLLALFAGLAVNVAWSGDREAALGKALAKEFERHEQILSDADVSRYVTRLAENLTQRAGLRITPAVKIVEGKDVRAAAFPGGYLYVSAGMIARAESEAELAGVLAHEIAHLAARHGMWPLPRDPNAAQPELPLVFRGGWAGVCGRFTEKTVPESLQDTVREFEKEADNLAVGYLRAAGYDPLAMIEFFNKFRYEARLAHAGQVEGLLALRSYVEQSLPPDPQYIVTTSAFERIHGRFVAEQAPRAPTMLSDRAILRRAPAAQPPRPANVP